MEQQSLCAWDYRLFTYCAAHYNSANKQYLSIMGRPKNIPTNTLHSLHIKEPKADRELDCLGSFLNLMGRHRLLTEEETLSYSRTVRKAMQIIEAHPSLKLNLTYRFSKDDKLHEVIGLSPEELNRIFDRAAHAKNKLIVSNLRLVVILAKGYARRQEESLIDLIQEGSVGLNRAVEKFDPTKGYKFSTYASCWIRQSISRSISQHSRVIRLPTMIYEQVNKLKRTIKAFNEEKGRLPTIAELAKLLGKTEERVQQLHDWCKRVCSSDIIVKQSDSDTTLGELMPSPNDTDLILQEIGYSTVLEELMSDTPERERKLLNWRFGLDGEEPLSAFQIGAIIGVSPERVRQVCNQELRRLKEKAGSQGLKGEEVFYI